MRNSIWLSLATLLTAQTLHAETLEACEQRVDYAIQRPEAGTPPNFSTFLGVWMGEWRKMPFKTTTGKGSETQCAVLIVERVDLQGNVSAIYLWGSIPYQWARPGQRRWDGKITADGRLFFPKGKVALYDATFTLNSPKSTAEMYGETHYNFLPGDFNRRR